MSRTQGQNQVCGFEAVIFDLDGVITDTAAVHAGAWKRLFDEYLALRARRDGEPFREFDAHGDYLAYVDGKPRYDGVRSFLQSRGVTIAEGSEDDGPEAETIHGLGNRKDGYFEEVMRRDGVRVFESSVSLIHELRARGVATAVVSSSRHCREVLERAGLQDLFDARVDGEISAALGLPGKPAPDIFLESASRLGVQPLRAVVVEDAVAGVEAGRRGGFALVIGIDRHGSPAALASGGADVVVSDLGEIGIGDIERAISSRHP